MGTFRIRKEIDFGLDVIIEDGVAASFTEGPELAAVNRNRPPLLAVPTRPDRLALASVDEDVPSVRQHMRLLNAPGLVAFAREIGHLCASVSGQVKYEDICGLIAAANIHETV